MEEGRVCPPQSVNPGTVSLKLELAAHLDELERMVGALDSFAGRVGLDSATLQQVTLALDELFTNIVVHGGIPAGSAPILLEIALTDGVLRIELSDPGRRFDPRTVAPPDTEASLEDRRIGGLGVHFVRTLMDSLDYRYADGRNHLTLTKRIEGAGR
jgi:serine/threonine-protein kinase RsbW